VKCFNGLGRNVAKFTRKGAKVPVQGRLHYSKWQPQDGIDKYSVEILADEVGLLDRAKSEGGEYSSAHDRPGGLPTRRVLRTQKRHAKGSGAAGHRAPIRRCRSSSSNRSWSKHSACLIVFARSLDQLATLDPSPIIGSCRRGIARCDVCTSAGSATKKSKSCSPGNPTLTACRRTLRDGRVPPFSSADRGRSFTTDSRQPPKKIVAPTAARAAADAIPDRPLSRRPRLLIGIPPVGRRTVNAMIYQAEYAFLTKRLDTVDRLLVLRDDLDERRVASRKDVPRW